jgi:steroid 5-alpha reductase family enzyme
MTKEKRIGILWLLVAYVFAFLVATYVYGMLEFYEIWKLLIANIAATTVIYFFSYAFDNASFYDPYWSVQPIVIGGYWIGQEEIDVNIARQAVVFLIILVWGIRLTANFLRGWHSLKHEDWRYIRLKEQSGKWFPLVSYFGIMMFPTLLVYVGCIPLVEILQKSSMPFGIWDFLGTAIGIVGISFQWISDNQLFKFIKTRKDHSEIIHTGLWRYSRHPNYFGEICIWTSFAIFSIGAVGDLEWYNSIGMVSVILLFNFISIPLQEKRLAERKPHYKKEQAIRSKIMPWKPKGE